MQVTWTYFIKFANRDLSTHRFKQGTQFPPYLFTFLGFSSAVALDTPQSLELLNGVTYKQKELAIFTIFLSKDENKNLVDAARCKFNEMSLIGESMYVLGESAA
jgi:hypothetical protein